MKPYMYPLIFLLAVSFLQAGTSLAGDEPKLKKVKLKQNEMLVLEEGFALVRQPHGTVQIVDLKGNVGRTIPKGKIVQGPDREVFIISGKNKIRVGKFGAIEKLRVKTKAAQPSAPSMHMSVQRTREMIAELGLAGQVLVRGGEAKVVNDLIKLEPVSKTKVNLVSIGQGGDKNLHGEFSCKCCVEVSRGVIECTDNRCFPFTTQNTIECQAGRGGSCAGICDLILERR